VIAPVLLGRVLPAWRWALAAVAWAASTIDFSLAWHAIVGGGGRSSSSDYVLDGSAGQPAADTLSSADFRLEGGFWPGIDAEGATFESWADEGGHVVFLCEDCAHPQRVACSERIAKRPVWGWSEEFGDKVALCEKCAEEHGDRFEV